MNIVSAPSVVRPRSIPIWRTIPADAIGIGVLIGLTTAVAWNSLQFDNWLSRTDILTYFLPWYAFVGEQLRAFSVPGWNPHQFSGLSAAGDPESGWMYLPAMVPF